MKNNQLPPKATVHLTRWAAEKFDELVDEARAVLGHKGQQHGVDFVINLLSYLSDTVYLQEGTKNNDKSSDIVDSLMFALNLSPINKSVIKDIDEQMDAIDKLMKNYKPPKAGEF